MPEGVPDRMSEEMPERTPERMSEEVPERMSEEMPESMSRKNAGEDHCYIYISPGGQRFTATVYISATGFAICAE